MQYEVLVDANVWHQNIPSKFIKQTFYSQLQHIYLVRFTQPLLALGTKRPITIIMAAIRTCKVDPHIQIPNLNFHFYSGLGKLDVVDITCLQCLVAQIPLTNAGGKTS